VAENLRQRRIRAIVKMEISFSAENDDIAPVRVSQNAFGRIAGLLERLRWNTGRQTALAKCKKAMLHVLLRVCEPSCVSLYLEAPRSRRNRIKPANDRLFV
jgi:hypothetical protein